MKIDQIGRIYFLGIGGIGMSALARYFLSQEKEIFGYDKTKTKLTKKLESEGMQIHYEEDVSRIPDNIDLVVYTPAISVENTEFRCFKNYKIALLKRSEVLGIISKEKKTIAIAGTHGKTTTAAILSHILKSLGKDPIAFVGGVMLNYKSNFLKGSSEWMIVEADEYDRSFLRLNPAIGVIGSMDSDHLDIYGDYQSMLSAFQQFSLNIKKNGQLWIYEELSELIGRKWREALTQKNIMLKTFGFQSADVRAMDLEIINSCLHFSYFRDRKKTDGFYLKMPGDYNVLNAIVSIAIAEELDCQLKDVSDALKTFQGIERRFEKVYEDEDVTVIIDYAHHPKELAGVIKATRSLYKGKKITGVFQPHLYTRTRDLAQEFAEALSELDELIMVEIYPAREKSIEGINSRIILDRVKINQKYYIEKKYICSYLNKKDKDVILILGAGDIDEEVPEIIKNLKNVEKE